MKSGRERELDSVWAGKRREEERKCVCVWGGGGGGGSGGEGREREWVRREGESGGSTNI